MDDKINRIIEAFEELQRWGKRGLLAEIAKKTGFTSAYVGQVFSGHKNPADKFILAVCSAYKIHESWVNKGTKPRVAPIAKLELIAERHNYLLGDENDCDEVVTSENDSQIDFQIFKRHGGVKAQLWEIIAAIDEDEAMNLLTYLRSLKFRSGAEKLGCSNTSLNK